jgi:MFS family permease
MNLLQPMMVAALLTGGLRVALLGTVKVSLAKRLQIDEARVGGLVSVFGFVLIPVILKAGFLSDLVGRQAVLVGGCALMAVRLFLLWQASLRCCWLARAPGEHAWRGCQGALTPLSGP